LDRKVIWPVKTGCWYVGGGDLTGALCILRVPVVTAANSRHFLLQHNPLWFDILAYPDCPGNWPLKQVLLYSHGQQQQSSIIICSI